MLEKEELNDSNESIIPKDSIIKKIKFNDEILF